MVDLSVVMTTYNQERYIGRALASVLAQEGPPLEIVVSDDRSTDRTWEVVEELARTYSGPHTLITHRQPVNLGTVDNLRWAIDRSSGAWIMLADGDDLSMPTRAMAVRKVIASTPARLVSTNAMLIDSDDNFVEQLIPKDRAASGWLSLEQLADHGWVEQVLGAAFAFDRQLITEFGHLDSGTLWAGGDHVLPIRAALMGGVLFLQQPLMCWRRHPEQATAELGEHEQDERIRRLGFIEHNLIGLRQALRDLAHWESTHPDDARVQDARGRLLGRMLSLSDAWTRARAGLHRDGFVSRYERRRGVGSVATENAS